MHGKKAIAVLCALCCAAAAAACTPDLAAPQQVYEITMGSPVFDQRDIRTENVRQTLQIEGGTVCAAAEYTLRNTGRFGLETGLKIPVSVFSDAQEAYFETVGERFAYLTDITVDGIRENYTCRTFYTEHAALGTSADAYLNFLQRADEEFLYRENSEAHYRRYVSLSSSRTLSVKTTGKFALLLSCQPSAVDYTTSGELTFTFAEAGDSFIEVVSLNPDDEIVTSMQLQEEYRTTIGRLFSETGELPEADLLWRLSVLNDSIRSRGFYVPEAYRGETEMAQNELYELTVFIPANGSVSVAVALCYQSPYVECAKVSVVADPARGFGSLTVECALDVSRYEVTGGSFPLERKRDGYYGQEIGVDRKAVTITAQRDDSIAREIADQRFVAKLLTALVLIGIAIGVSAPVILSLVRKKREAGADGKGDPS